MLFTNDTKIFDTVVIFVKVFVVKRRCSFDAKNDSLCCRLKGSKEKINSVDLTKRSV